VNLAAALWKQPAETFPTDRQKDQITAGHRP
jgi:hypothetical protein